MPPKTKRANSRSIQDELLGFGFSSEAVSIGLVVIPASLAEAAPFNVLLTTSSNLVSSFKRKILAKV